MRQLLKLVATSRYISFHFNDVSATPCELNGEIIETTTQRFERSSGHLTSACVVVGNAVAFLPQSRLNTGQTFCIRASCCLVLQTQIFMLISLLLDQLRDLGTELHKLSLCRRTVLLDGTKALDGCTADLPPQRSADTCPEILTCLVLFVLHKKLVQFRFRTDHIILETSDSCSEGELVLANTMVAGCESVELIEEVSAHAFRTFHVGHAHLLKLCLTRGELCLQYLHLAGQPFNFSCGLGLHSICLVGPPRQLLHGEPEVLQTARDGPSVATLLLFGCSEESGRSAPIRSGCNVAHGILELLRLLSANRNAADLLFEGRVDIQKVVPVVLKLQGHLRDL